MKRDSSSTPTWRSRMAAAWLGALVLTGAVALLAQHYDRTSQEILSEARARQFLSSITLASQEASMKDKDALQALITSLSGPDTGLIQARIFTEPQPSKYRFLKKRRYLAHSNPELSGQPLRPDRPEDKVASDVAARITSALKAGHPGTMLSIHNGSIRAAGPVMMDGKLLGMVELEARRPELPWSLDWTTLVLALAAALVLTALLALSPIAVVRVLSLAVVGGLGVFYHFALQDSYITRYDSAGQFKIVDLARLYAAMPAGLGVTEPKFLQAAARVEPEGMALELTGLRLGADPLDQAGLAKLIRMESPFPEEGGEVRLGAATAVLDGSKLASNRRVAVRGGVWALAFLILGGVLITITGELGWMGRFGDTVSDNGHAYAYTVPAMVGMVALVFLPFSIGLGLGFFKHSFGQYTFVGLDNFIDILFSQEYSITEPLNFYFTLGVTILWTVLNVFLHMAIGLALALVLKNPLLRLKAVYRVLLIIPWAIPNYITALIWKGMFHKQFGAVNALLAVFGVEPVGWFSEFSTSFAANVTTNTWLGFPFMMVISLGALQSIPTELYEAADVDGASRWQKFTQITLPLLKPSLFPAVILGFIWTFNMFNIVYLVSAGEPNNSTDILITEAYRWAFERGDRYGYAAAYSTVIFIILLLYSLATNRITKATEGVYD